MAKWILKTVVLPHNKLLLFSFFKIVYKLLQVSNKEPVYLTKSSDLADFFF